MGGLEIFLSYISRSSIITIIVLLWLSIYFIMAFTILISRNSGLNLWYKKEQKALESLLTGDGSISDNSVLRKCANGKVTKEKLNVCLNMAEKDATNGLTWLSIIASTSPFIGLFGTVISILDTFSKMGTGDASLSVIAPAISEALVATGAGILVAIPAYMFNLLIKRKAYEVLGVLKTSADIVFVMKNKNNSTLNTKLEEI